MRHYPTDDVDRSELADLNAPAWMLDLLKLNPSYCEWGPGEDYMSRLEGHGWSRSVEFQGWADFNWALDDLNECVNFYFEVERPSTDCLPCGGTGLNPETKEVADAFYAHDGRPGWCDKITTDELQALIDEDRVKGEATPQLLDEVNKTMRHDAINRWILVEARARRYGVWGHCRHCRGKGYTYTAPEARLNLVLWMLHPRKGCGRGVRIYDVARDDLPAVRALLGKARARNAERFSKIDDIPR